MLNVANTQSVGQAQARSTVRIAKVTVVNGSNSVTQSNGSNFLTDSVGVPRRSRSRASSRRPSMFHPLSTLSADIYMYYTYIHIYIYIYIYIRIRICIYVYIYI